MGVNRTLTDVAGIILAAGHGRRMRSRIPKPLHRAAGRELIRYPVDLLRSVGVGEVIVVVSPDNREAITTVLGDDVRYAVQPEALGTGDAVARGLKELGQAPGSVVVMAGDTPLVRAESVESLVREHAESSERRMTVLTARDVFGPDLGHVKRIATDGSGSVGPIMAIVEAAERVAPDDGPAEVNTGVYCFTGTWLAEKLPQLPRSASGEFYLTSLAQMGTGLDQQVCAAAFALPDEAMGVNDRQQLSAVETVLRDRINCHWMREGVTIVDAATTYIDAGAVIGPDTVILPNTMIAGETRVGQDCEVGPNSVIRDTFVGDGCRIVGSVLEEADVHSGVSIGPYSHLRPGTVIEHDVHLGNYVEVKNSRVGASTAAGHFCYLGDADIGAGVNIGAGTITCNYDGVDKHQTTIGDGAFIGSDTMLIAPVEVGEGAATGAGAVVNRDVPAAGRVVGVPARLLPNKSKERN